VAIESDVGKHELMLTVSDGELQTTVTQRLVVLPAGADKDYRKWFLVGTGPSAFITQGDSELFVGGAFDVSLFARIEDGKTAHHCVEGERQDGCYASHYRFYAEFEVLDSVKAGAPGMFIYGAGYSASFERDPGRRYLVPHYGIEVGGLARRGLSHLAQTRPYLGLHLWTGNTLWLNAAVGYRFVPAELATLSGPTAVLRAILSPF
jgi:hypothetical protein